MSAVQKPSTPRLHPVLWAVLVVLAVVVGVVAAWMLGQWTGWATHSL